ncbi:hypothetical protein ACEYW6_10545 [Nostoc sp. UIC 10607]|uniref:hypothetical protein n=1 Tax=Nostoc sp. UIC 10607 TaxID=3045935 RepID=UPI0039A3BC1E
MANNNSVTIVLNANAGQASAVISGLSNQINRDLSGSLGRATIGANLMTSAISLGLQSVGKLASKAIGLFNSAASTQSSIISTAGNVMKIAGYNFKEATSFVEDFQTQMAKVAAVLPGMTSDFTSFGRGIADDVLPYFAGLDGKLDSIERKAALDRLGKLTTYGTLLGRTAEQTSDAASMQASYFLSGTRSWARLKTLDFYSKNTTFRNGVEKDLAGRDLQKLSAKERQEIFLKNAQLDPAVLDALAESVEGVFGLVTDKFVGLETGIFGLMRDLNENTNGKQTAFGSINKSLLALFGTDGLTDQVSKALGGLGIVFADPMVSLRDAADDFTESIKQITSFFSQFNNRRPGQTLDDAKETLIEDLRYYFSNLFDFTTVGKSLAQAVNGMFNGIFAFINAGGLQSLIGGLAKGLGAFLTNLNWSTYATLLSGILVKKYLTYAFIEMGKLIATRMLASGAWTFALGFMGPIGAGLIQLGTLIGGTIGTGGALLIAALLGVLAYGIWKNRNFIGQKLQELGDSINNLFSTIFNWVKEQIAKVPGGETANKGLDAGASAIDGAKKVVSFFFNPEDENRKKLFKDPNAYNGLNNSSLMSAANRELLNAPPGAGLVMANSSETILNSSQQARIMSAMNTKPSISIGSIVIQTAATNAQDIAKDVVACIEKELQSFGQNYVAAPVV